MAEGVAGRLALESGACFDGWLFGADPDVTDGEVVFNTCMSGYQEVISDPSYAGQVVVMTHPLMGNYGCRDDTAESYRVHCRALVVRELSFDAGHARAERTLDDELRRWTVPGLRGVDTRALTRHLRDHGTLRGVIAPAAAMTAAHQVEVARTAPTVTEQDLVASVAHHPPAFEWTQPLDATLERGVELGGTRGAFRGLRVVVIDLGVKYNQLRALRSRGAEVMVMGHDATPEEVIAQRPDGVLLSNGPGDPVRLDGAVELTRALLEQRVPLLGICLGHQVLGRAVGATTSRLPFGHHGGNHPVRDEDHGTVHITSHNHEFQVDAASIPPGSGWYVSERNLNDGSVEGLRHRTLAAFSVQYHPEGAPGPQDRAEVFDEFLRMCRGESQGRGAGGEDGHQGLLEQASARLASVAETPLASPSPPSAPAELTAAMPVLAAASTLDNDPSANSSVKGRPNCVLVIGSGPVLIGQAAEFDYAGTQACRALREEGIKVVLVNSNPATIMTDDDVADVVYVEPLTVAVIERIVAAERPDGLLATLGGQTGLNLAVALDDAGVLERYGVQVLGTSLHSIRTAEDRGLFKALLDRIGEPVPDSRTVTSLAEARAFAGEVGLPLVVRPAYTLGGTGGGFCETDETLAERVGAGLAASPISQVLIERSLAGWRELEYEVMRDASGTCITVCNMENIDPMGVHTGDSIVVAPAQTLTDREHQQLRSAALRIISALDIRGGCNVQFAMHPQTHEYYVIEVNPRVSRSSALASKATGYPIARLAAKIAAGRRLHEIANAVTGKTCAAFEPALDYCAVKIPRWPFDKFPDADRRLGTQMKSTGEVMALERSFEAAFNKAIRSLEQRRPDAAVLRDPVLVESANDRRAFAVMEALRAGATVAEVAHRSTIAPWFVQRLRTIVDCEERLRWGVLTRELLAAAKHLGVGDARIAELRGEDPAVVRARRDALGLRAVYKCVDTCAAEFEARTPYYYSTYDSEDEGQTGAGSAGRAVVVVGSGPIRIGQGIEFDYCSVRAAQALRDDGAEAVMINSNPETVSTDFDCSDRLYFEPLDAEAVLAVIAAERPRGVVVQFGGQTAVNLARPLHTAGVAILGSDVDTIDAAEDRRTFEALMRSLAIPQPHGAATTDIADAIEIAERIGYPVLVRPSYVLGGRAMEVVHTRGALERYLVAAMAVLPEDGSARRGDVLVDKYLFGTEVDVDAICDGETVIVPGLMEHIERAGVHSGDSMAAYPAPRLDSVVCEQIVTDTVRIAKALRVRGLCNVQFVVYRGRAHVIEVNPRASRTVPFLSKVSGVPMVDLAVRVMGGQSLASLGWSTGLVAPRPLVAVKAPVFSTVKLTDVDTVLGPEMKSTGEVMGIDVDLGAALEKAFLAALGSVPSSGGTLCSIADSDKAEALPILAQLSTLGFTLYATAGTMATLAEAGITAIAVGKLGQARPNVIDVIEEGRVQLVINTVSHLLTNEMDYEEAGAGSVAAAGRTVKDGYRIRLAAEQRRIPCCTSLDTAAALVDSMSRQQAGERFAIAPVRAYREGAVGAMQ
ncbi:MAG: carbamoyl-phosphate synthase large subunit [Candidatus Dormibacteraeota bacterium]|uniref:Multifunctional fusion protein n=1 Tax=Candidatus Amunia macphersoniae TaxID=3127014 RepID=A0A934NGC4_9BACT|nr:carbamoyl-phosphate synthase large subunit [Candidatus Dormibacteraeota bacterium]